MANKVIYLTGIPGVGKTTVINALSKKTTYRNIRVFSYGEELLKLHSEIDGLSTLRSSSSKVITEADVRLTDDRLRDFVEQSPDTVIIESHAVTVETYGFRVVPFNLSVLNSLGISHIVALFDTPDNVLCRIRQQPQGRIIPSKASTFTAQNLQLSIAASYAILCSASLYCFDVANENLINEMVVALSLG